LLIGIVSGTFPLQAACPGGVSTSFTVSGDVTNRATFNLDKLQRFPPAQANVTYFAAGSVVTEAFTGVLLWDLLNNSPVNGIVTNPNVKNDILHKVVIVTGATATLASHIIGGNSLKVDLFLAADTDTSLDLYLNHFKLVAPYNSSNTYYFTPPLYMFNYAMGVLALLSNTPGVDVTCDAGGTCGYDPKVYSTVAIADPSLAPYWVAAQTVLSGRYGLMPPLSSNPLVHEYPNITAALNAVLAKTDPVGFVAMSAICSSGTYPTSGTSALAYFSIEVGSEPGTLINNYNPLTQAGIAIRNYRTAAQDTELESFVAFLTDFTTSPSPDSPMISTLKKYCYSAP
jgi:ABC-type molybdate transport system substrate-binding protein